ncbi:MAG: respiratory nitrate reductase subunit gamma [Betaproteobacteria bacterium]
MSTVTLLYVAAFYLAGLVFIVGLARRIADYARTPAPLRIPTTPAPLTGSGVAVSMAREVMLFESLFKSSKWTWLFGWMFHAALLLVSLRHLRYVTDPVWTWVQWVQPFGVYAGFALIAGLAGLWARRVMVDRVRYISTPSDHLMLALLLAIGVSGMSMRFVAHTDIIATKAFMLGLLTLDPQPLPTDPMLLVHLALVIVLMIIFPISKLLHAPGIFFSPTRNQSDNARDNRHVTAWATTVKREG